MIQKRWESAWGGGEKLQNLSWATHHYAVWGKAENIHTGKIAAASGCPPFTSAYLLLRDEHAFSRVKRSALFPFELNYRVYFSSHPRHSHQLSESKRGFRVCHGEVKRCDLIELTLRLKEKGIRVQL